ncbi:mannose-1-phosphate guanylyltransferase/mannose-6-phosphate isomerase [Snodgrassella alvi]|uniref:mannose-1-phosphate guanylyltransferase n=1 Tax=Snodgrassella alvi TaxID=1196083 RepID=A0A2N9XVS4_9NEIS|nr:mannose-1-phosphate guanylyltransferase/mannose-6-phosphate isomerase [Snodgrassella alvi]PIT53664.1 mannose-1-phosphate guanylyltransferase/mannose-6-phosphate isomerase [Snodgrassella alvi]
MINIILCGGQGTRLWPISRNAQPKQYIPLIEGQSLFQKTVCYNKESCNRFYLITNQDQYFLSKEQLSHLNSIDNSQFLIEPIGRNTAPAIALACLDLNEDDIVLVTPSDHLITQQQNYQTVLQKAKDTAERGFLVTIGVTPTSPETGYGYIECDNGNKNEVLDVTKFHEKPNAQTVLQYISSGKFYWNAGIFCFKAGVFLKELSIYAPEIFDACVLASKNAERKDNVNQISLEDMLNIPENSIDYAVLEKSKIIKMIPAQFGWSDLGCFDALDQILPKDEQGNTTDQHYIGLNSHNNLILGHDRAIATIDINDCIIVDTPDALLIANKGSSQKVKQLINKLEKNNKKLLLEHKTMYRPWGSYTVLEDVDGYKIKRIEVKPGKRLSLQRHWHRSEHWIVVSGTATVTIGDDSYFVRPNESTYIRMGEVHRLANDGKIPVVLIEAQVGEYTGEDDIERLEDDFKRY